MSRMNTPTTAEVKQATVTLYSSGTLARNEDEEKLLTAFRQLDDVHKACELARLDGMLTVLAHERLAM